MQTRPLTSEERTYLKGYFGETRFEWGGILLNLAFGLIIFTCLLFALLNVFFRYILQPLFGWDWFAYDNSSLWLVGLALALGLVVNMMRSLFAFKRKSGRKLREALARNEAEIHSLTLTRAVELQEWGDEGAGFFLETNDNRVLFVRGQDLYDYAHDAEEGEPPEGPFPTRHLTLVREAMLGIRLDLKPEGEALPLLPPLKRQSFMQGRGKTRQYIGPDDATFYEGTLEDVLQRFGFKDALSA